MPPLPPLHSSGPLKVFSCQETRSANQAPGTGAGLVYDWELKECLLPVQRVSEPGPVYAVAKPTPGFLLQLLDPVRCRRGSFGQVVATWLEAASLLVLGWVSRLRGGGAEAWGLAVQRSYGAEVERGG